jgi:RNA polymerase sigma-70 factor (ECF subfamily)
MTDFEFKDGIIKLEPILKRFAITLVKDKEIANDLVQDTYLKALLYKNKYQDGTNLKAWLFTILKNSFINDYRREKKANTIFDRTNELYYIDLSSDKGYISPESTLYTKELNQLIQKLNPVLYDTFIMYLEGFKYEEISEILNIKLGTIKSRIFFARKELMDCIENNKISIYNINKKPCKQMEKIILKFKEICNLLIKDHGYNKNRIVIESGVSWPTFLKIWNNDVADISITKPTQELLTPFIQKWNYILSTVENIKSVSADLKQEEIKPKIKIDNMSKKTKSKLIQELDLQPLQKVKADTFWSLLAQAMDYGIPENVTISVKINQ